MQRSQSRKLSGVPDTVADRPLTIRHCSSDFSSTAGRLFENHLPEHVLQRIRYTLTSRQPSRAEQCLTARAACLSSTYCGEQKTVGKCQSHDTAGLNLGLFVIQNFFKFNNRCNPCNRCNPRKEIAKRNREDFNCSMRHGSIVASFEVHALDYRSCSCT